MCYTILNYFGSRDLEEDNISMYKMFSELVGIVTVQLQTIYITQVLLFIYVQ